MILRSSRKDNIAEKALYRNSLPFFTNLFKPAFYNRFPLVYVFTRSCPPLTCSVAKLFPFEAILRYATFRLTRQVSRRSLSSVSPLFAVTSSGRCNRRISSRKQTRKPPTVLHVSTFPSWWARTRYQSLNQGLRSLAVAAANVSLFFGLERVLARRMKAA